MGLALRPLTPGFGAEIVNLDLATPLAKDTVAEIQAAFDRLMWDNRAVLHRATEYDTAVEPRIVRRTVVPGDEPY